MARFPVGVSAKDAKGISETIRHLTERLCTGRNSVLNHDTKWIDLKRSEVVTSIVQEVAKAYPATKSTQFHTKLVLFKIKGAVHRATKSLRKSKGLTQTGQNICKDKKKSGLGLSMHNDSRAPSHQSRLPQQQGDAEALLSHTQFESLSKSDGTTGEQQASTSDVNGSSSARAPTPLAVNTCKHQGDVGNIIAKASSFQETFCGFAVGDIIPKGTPVVPVVELESTAALTAVGYARTSFDMAAQERSDRVPLELIAIDDDAMDVHKADSPFSITGELFRLAFPSASGPHTLDGLWQEHKFEWPGVALSVRHPALDWNFDKLVKRLGRPVFSPNRADRMVLANVDQNTMSTSKEGACSKRNAQPSRIDEPAAGVRNENDDVEGSDLDVQGASQAVHKKKKHRKTGPQSNAAVATQARVTRSRTQV